MSGSRLIIELQTAVIVCSDGSVVVIAVWMESERTARC
jgi:hypothetical protein